MSTTESRRDWKWDNDGTLDGMYVETRQVVPKSGLVFDFHVGPDDELVSVWETAVIRSKLAAGLKRRQGKVDFERRARMLRW